MRYGSRKSRYVGGWLADTLNNRGEQIQALEEIKRKTLRGLEHLEQFLTGDILPHPRRKADIIQACHNVLGQMWHVEEKVFEDLPCPSCGGRVFYASILAGLACDTCWRRWDDTAAFRAEAQGNRGMEFPITASLMASPDYEAAPGPVIVLNRPNGVKLSIPRLQFLDGDDGLYQPKTQEFDCPRCGEEKVMGVNGSRRWCLNCNVEWPTATAFLAEAQAERCLEPAVGREAIKARLRELLNLVDTCPAERLAEIGAWLDDLETAFSLGPEEVAK